ncbi:Holliday junction resolvasome RuvABC endonuclease subunit [Rhizobium azibense]|nr:Holliday junction resolvasome RuvABC endonuclease subunit [Rhizobium azibense]
MTKIKIAGLDGSLRNFGIAKMEYDINTAALSVLDLKLIETEKEQTKKMRASSDTFERAKKLAAEANEFTKDCVVTFAEVPFGGKSYDAVLGFGIVIGIYASLDVVPEEVAPAQTKIAAVGTRTASKEEMIDWAFKLYPTAPWLTTKRGGVLVPVQKNEHLADGVGVCHAGIKLPSFKQAIAIIAASQKAAA